MSVFNPLRFAAAPKAGFPRASDRTPGAGIMSSPLDYATSPHQSDVAGTSEHGGQSPAPSMPLSARNQSPAPSMPLSDPRSSPQLPSSPMNPQTPVDTAQHREGTSPLSMLQTPLGSQRSRASAASRRNDLGQRSQHGSQHGSDHPGSDASGLGGRGDETADSGSRSTIWGTDIDVLETTRQFEAFFDHFRKEGAAEDSPPFYYLYLEQLQVAQEYALNLDCRHLHTHNAALYNKLVAYPGEMLFICDSVVQELFQRLYPDNEMNQKFIVRAFGLKNENRLRDLDPMDIDKLVMIKGMVTRVTAVIPDMKVAFFECSVCRAPHQVRRGRNHRR